MIHFLNIVIQEKSAGEDYRAFLHWADSEVNIEYEIRGYGYTPGEAADDAYEKFKEDRIFYAQDSWDWK